MPALTCDGRLRPVTRWYIVPAIGDSYSIDITSRAAAMLVPRYARLPPLTQTRRTRYASQRCATTVTALILFCDDTSCLCSGSLSTGLAKYKNKYKYKTHKIAQRALLAWSRTCARDALTNIR